MTSMRAVTALIVGGGPVAQIIGKHLTNAGVTDIALLLKPKYAMIADQGFEMHRFRTFKKKRERHRYDDFKILTSVETLEQVHYDQIYICLSGPDLRSGWLEQAWPHLRHSLWISFTPGVDDEEYLLKTIPERFLVMGRPGFIAFDAPLPGGLDINPPGVAWWYVPWRMTYFKSADAETAASVARTFERGGLPAGTSSSFDGDRLYENAATTAFAATLEIHGWDFQALLNDTTALARLCVTQGEIGAAILARHGTDSNFSRRLRKVFWWKMILKNLDGWVPFKLRAYIEYHFSKHRRQMEQQFGDYVRLIKATGGEPTGTQSLAREWARKRPQLAERSIDHLMPLGMTANTASRSVFSETGELGGEARGKTAADGAPATQALSAIQGPPTSGVELLTHAHPAEKKRRATMEAAMPQQGFPQQGMPQQQGFPPQQQQGFPPQQQGFPPQQQGFPPQQQQGLPPQQQQGFPPQQQQGFPPQQQQGFPPQQQGFPPQQQQGVPPQQQGFPPQQQGFPPQQQQGVPPQQQGFPPQQQGFPPQQQQGFPPQQQQGVPPQQQGFPPQQHPQHPVQPNPAYTPDHTQPPHQKGED